MHRRGPATQRARPQAQGGPRCHRATESSGPGLLELGAAQPEEKLTHWGPTTFAGQVQVKDSRPFRSSEGILCRGSSWRQVGGQTPWLLLAPLTLCPS